MSKKKESLTLEDGTDREFRNIGLNFTPRNDSEDGIIEFNRDGSLRSRKRDTTVY
jgi:hypothetical protein